MKKLFRSKKIRRIKEAGIIYYFNRKAYPILFSSSHHNDSRGAASRDDWTVFEANQFSHGVASIYRWVIPYIWNSTNLLGLTNGFKME